MFRSISLKEALASIFSTFSRFIWVLILVIFRTAVHISLIEDTKNTPLYKELLTKLLLIGLLACPLMIGISFAAERRSHPRRWKLIGFGLLLILMVLYFLFGISPSPTVTDYYRFAVLFVGAHLWVAYAPFLKHHESNAFWQFNKALFLQFLNATLYAVTLFIGLLIAVKTVEFLFEIKYLFEIEADLAILIFSFFHSLFFLSKVPAHLAHLQNDTSYPTGLKIFTQYVLLPLEVVYLLILYVYTGKILINWSLPSGGVAYLVLAFSVAGIFALLLLYPLRHQHKEKWVHLFSRRFYLALLPLLILLFVGILRRIYDYGITENRYIVVAMACWLGAQTLYFLFSKRKDIIWIPISLSILCLFLVFGPWNIFQVSRKSQLAAFRSLAQSRHLLNDKGKIVSKSSLSAEEYEQLFSIVNYFKERDSTALAIFFPNPLPTPDNSSSGNDQYTYLSRLISNKGSKNESISFGTDYDEVMEVAGFEHLKSFDSFQKNSSEKEEWSFVIRGSELIISKHGTPVMLCDLRNRVRAIGEKYGYIQNNIPKAAMTFEGDHQGKRLRVVLYSITMDQNKNFITNGVLLY
ncbi:DUF4153 domain-containing protein [Dyadobacter tibetensis]|uniref:DUF4153 domain-containing protein n=1 Tax=Dyadobacter tibetensis TaxID=1211851 RepID=UPI00047003BD|nr:DUF4153 domain-containing protein [Dyadobacter tibetensis]